MSITSISASPTNVTLSPRMRMLSIGLSLVAIMSVTRLWTGFDNLTSSGTIGAALRLTVPIMLAGLAGLWAERVGILNIGIEGMMILGTWFGAFGAWKYGPWIGFLFAIFGGALGGLIHAVATIRFNIDQVISGVVMNLLAFFGVRYLSELVFVGQPQGGISQSPPQSSAIPKVDVPFLAGGPVGSSSTPDALGWLEERGWFLIADLSGMTRGLMSGLSLASFIALLLVPLSAWVLWRTSFGLRLRSSGEAPEAAESLGVNVIRVRYIALLISGGFAGLGGGFLSIISSSYYRQGQTAGRGFIGLATMIFGNWRPSGILGGAAVFGYSEGIKLVAGGSITGLFLFIFFVSAIVGLISLLRRQMRRGTTGIGVSVISLIAYLTVDEVPESLTQSLPYLITLIVLATASQRLRPPAKAGVPYRPGGAH
ncbi:MAG: ABC transporter permease [Acidimicrobiaceae bacterium]|nr:ABC transporter permease [Acidimicrobiaceae bacterium]HBU75126.1 ABC transporter permease [Acidimicrobiaceae bacterium]